MARPTIGATAPDFTLRDQSGNTQTLSAILQHKAVVLYFYPKNETYGCIKEACAFRDSHEAFTDMGVEVIGVSADSVDSHAQFQGHHKLPFILLSDPDKAVHKRYGVDKGFLGLIAARVTFVIDQQGIVRNVFDSLVDFEGHVKASMAALQGSK